MSFASFQFILFFPITTLLYFLLPHRFRISFLLLISCLFYMAFIPKFIFILFAIIVIDYYAGIWIETAPEKNRKKILFISILANLSILFFFKYFNFFGANLESLAKFLGWNYSIEKLAVVLPIGLSFHTFQSMSYTFEIYYRRQRAERNFLIYAVYVMFYPQLVAGPIERPGRLLPQFHTEHTFDYLRITGGLRLMAWGFFKKIVIADRMALLVDPIYNNPSQYSGLALALATIFFAFQIYGDFSGYCDIGIGAARVLGISMMQNFRYPYLSQSIEEFWTRWHISLSSWFRDYVYIPLGGNRKGPSRRIVNVFIVFFLSGFWHGANWTFILWGILNALFLFLEWIFTALTSWRPHSTIKILLTFLCICLTWVAFRANTIHDAILIYSNLWKFNFSLPHESKKIFWAFFFITLVTICDFSKLPEQLQKEYFLKNSTLRWAFYYVLIASITWTAITASQPPKEFIYFQF